MGHPFHTPIGNDCNKLRRGIPIRTKLGPLVSEPTPCFPSVRNPSSFPLPILHHPPWTILRTTTTTLPMRDCCFVGIRMLCTPNNYTFLHGNTFEPKRRGPKRRESRKQQQQQRTTTTTTIFITPPPSCYPHEIPIPYLHWTSWHPFYFPP